MCRNHYHSAVHSGGFTMPIAIFILVIMALIGVAMTKIASTGALSIANETFSVRALYAAESGAQWAMNKIFPLNGTYPGCFSNTTLNYSSAGLSRCQADVSCQDNGMFNGHRHYQITSRGQCGDAVRELQVGARQP